MTNKLFKCFRGFYSQKVLIALLLVIAIISIFQGCKKETGIKSISKTASSGSTDFASTAGTFFGTQVGETLQADNLTVVNLLGVKYVRVEIILKEFTGSSSRIDSYINNGYKILLNLNYGNPQNSNGTKTPVPFPTDMVEYRRLLGNVLDVYNPDVAVIENEPTTSQYHSGPIENYITELKTAVDVCNKRGIKVADGSTNVQRVQQVMNGQITGFGDALAQTATLITAYKTIPLTYVNVHSSAPFNSTDNPNVYPPGVLESVANYLRTTTGKPVMCNEYNQDNQSAALMTSAVNAYKAGGYVYMVARSNKGGTGKAQPLNKGTKLTTIGMAFRDAIK